MGRRLRSGATIGVPQQGVTGQWRTALAESACALSDPRGSSHGALLPDPPADARSAEWERSHANPVIICRQWQRLPRGDVAVAREDRLG
jgi:hypothetical protein